MPPRFSDARASLSILPRGRGCARAWIYAIGLPGGWIKVGMSRRPYERAVTHWRESVEGLAWVHVFQASDIGIHTQQIERRAHVLLSGVATATRGREVFAGVTKAEAIRIVRKAYAQGADAVHTKAGQA